MLGRTQQSQRMVLVTLKLQHGVNNMFKDARPCKTTVFGDMANEDDGDVVLLGDVDKALGTPTHLGHASR
jgi:hypothetical protein